MPPVERQLWKTDMLDRPDTAPLAVAGQQGTRPRLHAQGLVRLAAGPTGTLRAQCSQCLRRLGIPKVCIGEEVTRVSNRGRGGHVVRAAAHRTVRFGMLAVACRLQGRHPPHTGACWPALSNPGDASAFARFQIEKAVCDCRQTQLGRPAFAMASGVYFMSMQGKCLIQRTYRHDVPHSVHAIFRRRVIDTVDDTALKPVFQEGPFTFVYIRHNELYLVAVTNHNANAMVILHFLYDVVDTMKSYFTTLVEESIRDNFVLFYELLDEMMDYGYPQATETKALQMFIKPTDANKVLPPKIPDAVTGASPWRPNPSISHSRNEIFLDVIEHADILVSASGSILHSEIRGTVKMKSFLSGMPELKLGLNDKVLMARRGRRNAKSVDMEDVRFHQCVRLSRFESSRTISFVPPDGEFEFMRYRLSTKMRPLIWIDCSVEHHNRSRIEYMIKAKSNYKKRSVANGVVITVPVPPDADSPTFKASEGKVAYDATNSCMVWSIPSFPGQKQFMCRGHFGLPSVDPEDADPTMAKSISVKFEIPYFTISGIQVRYLKITEKSGYKALPWVRYITRNGSYQIRMR